MLSAFKTSGPMRLLFQVAIISWFAIGDAGLGHSCPTHWRSGPAQSVDPHASHGTQHAPDPTQPHGSCTCVGTCTAANGSSLPAVPVATHVVSATITGTTGPAAACALVARDAHHPLPYGNGPPAL